MAHPFSDVQRELAKTTANIHRGKLRACVCACVGAFSLTCVCVRPHQPVHLHEFLVLLMKLFGLYLQNHLKTLQLLSQIQHMGVLL